MTHMNRMLAPKFEEDGFAIIERLFSEDEIMPISDEVNKIIEGRAEYFPEDDIVYEPEGSTKRVRNAFRLTEHNPFFLDVACDLRIISVVEGILGSPLRLYSSQLFAKPPRIGSEVPLHQDLAYWPFEPAELLSCWIALDDSNVANGCVRFIRGSHKLGLLRHIPSQVSGNSLALEDERIAGLEEAVVEVSRGSVVLHHCLTAHRSETNPSTKPRRGLINIYMSANVRLTDPQKLKANSQFPIVSSGR